MAAAVRRCWCHALMALGSAAAALYWLALSLVRFRHNQLWVDCVELPFVSWGSGRQAAGGHCSRDMPSHACSVSGCGAMSVLRYKLPLQARMNCRWVCCHPLESTARLRLDGGDGGIVAQEVFVCFVDVHTAGEGESFKSDSNHMSPACRNMPQGAARPLTCSFFAAH